MTLRAGVFVAEQRHVHVAGKSAVEVHPGPGLVAGGVVLLDRIHLTDDLPVMAHREGGPRHLLVGRLLQRETVIGELEPPDVERAALGQISVGDLLERIRAGDAHQHDDDSQVDQEPAVARPVAPDHPAERSQPALAGGLVPVPPTAAILQRYRGRGEGRQREAQQGVRLSQAEREQHHQRDHGGDGGPGRVFHQLRPVPAPPRQQRAQPDQEHQDQRQGYGDRP